jgi:hypothetical protein
MCQKFTFIAQIGAGPGDPPQPEAGAGQVAVGDPPFVGQADPGRGREGSGQQEPALPLHQRVLVPVARHDRAAVAVPGGLGRHEFHSPLRRLPAINDYLHFSLAA